MGLIMVRFGFDYKILGFWVSVIHVLSVLD